MSGDHYIENYQIPVGIRTLEQLQNILRQTRLFLSLGDESGRYQVLTYRREKAHNNSDTYALLDRNTLNDVFSIVRPAVEGRTETCAERGRIGAAMMAFLQSANVLIEPSIALYENPALAAPELALFRQADDISPEVYAQLALGQIDCLPLGCIPAPPQTIPAVDFSRPITNTQKFRIALLKIAALDLSSLANADKLRRFLQWSFEEFCILAVPTLIAITHFSPHRKSSILQSLRSPERARALQGVQNAVWDILTIQQWAKNVGQQSRENRIWLLCSRDEALKRIAEVLHCTDESTDQSLRNIFKEWWNSGQGDELADLAISLQKDPANPNRRANKPNSEEYLNQLEENLKRQVLEWVP